ncbi:MAG: TonB-dependent receptor [Bryobacter sp.]|nr:TonB-dependent receptor [Bryobacter sp.]
MGRIGYRIWLNAWLLWGQLLLSQPLLAQGAGSLEGTLTDPSGTPVGGVPVRVQGPVTREAITNPEGIFVLRNLPAGKYVCQIQLQGFQPIRSEFQVARGRQTRLAFTFSLAEIRSELEIQAQPDLLSVEAGSNQNTVTVSSDLLSSLPILDLDAVAALQGFLDPSAAENPNYIMDGAESRNVTVTPSAVQEIKINNNPYTAEFPRWSRRRIEVITKPAGSRWRGTFNFLNRDFRLNAREAFALERPKERRRTFEGSVLGPAPWTKKASLLFSAWRKEDRMQRVIFAQTLGGILRENVPAPAFNNYVSAQLTLQPSNRQSMFFQQNFRDLWANNVGIGGITLAESGMLYRYREDEFVFNHSFVVNPRLLSQLRVLVGRHYAPNRSNLQEPRRIVSGAFINGGSQQDRTSREVHTAITWMFTQSTGRHTLKYGFNIPDWSRRSWQDLNHQQGTFTYTTLADFAADRPLSILLQQGDPLVRITEKLLGLFVQDDYQLRPNLQLSLGLRYDWQNFFGDAKNLAPRVAVAWSPQNNRKMVVRLGGGYFFDRSGAVPMFDILRFNGVQLRRYLLTPPDLTVSPSTPTTVHQLARDTQIPEIIQFSGTLEYQLAKRASISVGYLGYRGLRQFASRDANAPLPENFRQRPDPQFNALRILESSGRIQSDALELALRGSPHPKFPLTLNYTLGRTLSNTDGANFYPAASYFPSGEWGRDSQDRRHTVNLLGTANIHKWLQFGYTLAAYTGRPYNITTGRDNNGDGLVLDRPEGTARNAGQGPAYASLDLRWYHDFLLMPSRKEKSPTLTIGLDSFNLFNRVNFSTFVGEVSSPFFGQAVQTLPARRIQTTLRLRF